VSVCRVASVNDRVRFAWDVVALPRWEARNSPFSQADQPLQVVGQCADLMWLVVELTMQILLGR
jgi:hypothetical protein